MSETPLTNIIMHEIMAYEKFNGKKPAFLILIDTELKDKFFSESYFAVMKHDVLDFKTPGYFMGVKMIHKKINCYGGSCRWMLASDE